MKTLDNFARIKKSLLASSLFFLLLLGLKQWVALWQCERQILIMALSPFLFLAQRISYIVNTHSAK